MIRRPLPINDENVNSFARPGIKPPHPTHNKLGHSQGLEPLTPLSPTQFAEATSNPVKSSPVRTNKKKHSLSRPEPAPSNIVILGDPRCGKSTLVHTYLNQRFTEAPESILFETYEKEIHFNNDTSVKLQVWDFPGDHNFDRFRPLAYADAKGVLICFDLSSPESYHNVKERWIPEVEAHCPSAHRILVGLGAECRLDKDEGGRVPNVDFFQKTAERLHCKYFEPFLSSPRSYCKVFEEMALLISGVNENKLGKFEKESMNEAVPYLRAATMTKTRADTIGNNGSGLSVCEEKDGSDIKTDAKISRRRTSFQKRRHRGCIMM